jgi:hypothetical protein
MHHYFGLSLLGYKFWMALNRWLHYLHKAAPGALVLFQLRFGLLRLVDVAILVQPQVGTKARVGRREMWPLSTIDCSDFADMD